jgi:hypothetical protein
MLTVQTLGPKFSLGALIASDRVLNLIPREEILEAVENHVAGRASGARAIAKFDTSSNDVLSTFVAQSGKKFFIRTDAERSATTIFLEEEFKDWI